MLNFLWKKTSRKSTTEPPIIQASSVHGGSFENVHRYKQKTSRPSSMYVEANGYISHPLQVTASTSFDEHRFVDTCVNPNENHTQYGEVDTCLRDKNASKNKSESQLNCLANEPAKYYNSPKIGSRYQPSTRNSGHSRSHSVYSNIQQINSERTATKTEIEGTPRMYKKNHLNSSKIMPLHGGLANVSFDGSTTGSVHSESQGSQWSFWEEGCSDPVPPPRKRRSRPRESFSETSSQSSTDRTEISKLTVNTGDVEERKCPENHYFSPVCKQDSIEFGLHLPPGFSNLGLNMMTVEFNTAELNSDLKPTDQNDETPEQCTGIKQDDGLKLESTHEPEIISPCADLHLNRDSVSSEETHTNINSDILPQKTKLRSETIVKSLFTKGKKCPDSVLGSAETEEQTRTVVIDANTTRDKYCEQNHINLPKTLPELPEVTENGFTNISEFQDTRVEHVTKRHPLWCHESSTDDVFYTPVSDETEWTIAFCSSGIIPRGCGNGSQPDVLIGTDQKVLNSSLSSVPSDSDQSFDAGQEDNKGVEVCRLPVEKELLVRDLVVFHQLQDSPSNIVVEIGETSTSQEVIEQILHLENLPPDWYLYKLCTKTLDPKVINNGYVELDFRDCPLTHLNQKHRGGNVRFELHQKEGVQIRVTCDAGPERTKSLVLEISCDETCRNVLHIAAQKFGLHSAAKLCLIQVERNEKGCPMKRVPENQIVAQLPSDYFLLCEQEFLAGASDIHDHQSFVTSSRTKSQSRSSYSPGSPSTVELDRLEKKVANLETKLVECEKICQQKLQKQQNQLDRYRAIAFCTDPVTKVMLLEAEIQRLTREMQDQEHQMQMYRGKTSSQSEYERKNLEDELTAMKKSLSATEKERTEAYTFLTAARTEELETNKTSASRKVAPPMYGVCREYQGSCLYGLELDRSSLTGQEQLPLKNNINHVCNGQNNGVLRLMEGDRILEINGQLVHHLNEEELLSVVGEMTEKLRVVVLREETPTTDIYVL